MPHFCREIWAQIGHIVAGNWALFSSRDQCESVHRHWNG